jgi:hypothetical protein
LTFENVLGVFMTILSFPDRDMLPVQSLFVWKMAAAVLQTFFLPSLYGFGIIGAINKIIGAGLVLRYPEFGCRVVFQLIIVPVK